MARRKIIRTTESKPNLKSEEKAQKLSAALDGLQDMNKQLMQVNAGLKHNTNKMVDEIGRCLDDIFKRLLALELYCGIVTQTQLQTNDVPTEETATSTDTLEMSSNSELPVPSVEESLAQ